MRHSSSADEAVVYGVGSYPEPQHDVFMFYGERPVMQTHAGGPIASHLLAVPGRVLRVLSQELVGCVRQTAYVVGKLPITCPKPWIGPVPHRSVQRPAR